MTAIPQHSSASAEHPTPVCVVEPARRLLGAIDLDPATTAAFNATIRARWFYEKADDGLRQPWHGRTFLNPPGGKLKRVGSLWVPVEAGPGTSSMQVWWDKLAGEWGCGHVTAAVFVGFTLEILRTSQACCLPVQAFPRCYPSERLAFGGDDPTHANVIVYLPPRDVSIEAATEAMRREFGGLGLVEGGMGAA